MKRIKRLLGLSNSSYQLLNNVDDSTEAEMKRKEGNNLSSRAGLPVIEETLSPQDIERHNRFTNYGFISTFSKVSNRYNEEVQALILKEGSLSEKKKKEVAYLTLMSNCYKDLELCIRNKNPSNPFSPDFSLYDKIAVIHIALDKLRNSSAEERQQYKKLTETLPLDQVIQNTKNEVELVVAKRVKCGPALDAADNAAERFVSAARVVREHVAFLNEIDDKRLADKRLASKNVFNVVPVLGMGKYGIKTKQQLYLEPRAFANKRAAAVRAALAKRAATIFVANHVVAVSDLYKQAAKRSANKHFVNVHPADVKVNIVSTPAPDGNDVLIRHADANGQVDLYRRSRHAVANGKVALSRRFSHAVANGKVALYRRFNFELDTRAAADGKVDLYRRFNFELDTRAAADERAAAVRVDPGHVAAVKAAAAKNAELAAERAERAKLAKLDAESAAVELDAKKAAAKKAATIFVANHVVAVSDLYEQAAKRPAELDAKRAKLAELAELAKHNGFYARLVNRAKRAEGYAITVARRAEDAAEGHAITVARLAAKRAAKSDDDLAERNAERNAEHNTWHAKLAAERAKDAAKLAKRDAEVVAEVVAKRAATAKRDSLSTDVSAAAAKFAARRDAKSADAVECADANKRNAAAKLAAERAERSVKSAADFEARRTTLAELAAKRAFHPADVKVDIVSTPAPDGNDVLIRHADANGKVDLYRRLNFELDTRAAADERAAAVRVDPGHVAAVKAAAKNAELAAERAERAKLAKLDAESAAVELDAKKAAAAKLAKLDAESAAASTTAATKNDATGDTNNPLHPYNKTVATASETRNNQTVAIQSYTKNDGTGYTNNPLHPYNKTVATAAETRNNKTVAIQSDGTGDTKPTTAATKPTNTNFVTRMLTAGTSTTNNNTTIESYLMHKNTQRSKS